MLKLVNTGLPRSGTKYFSVLFTELGIHTAHEKIYNRWTDNYIIKEDPYGWKIYDGCSNFTIAPHGWMFKDSFLINQRRNKKDNINSLNKLGMFQELKVPHLHYHNYFFNFVPEAKTTETFEERLSILYDKWNEIAAKYAKLVYYIDDMDEYLIRYILERIDAPLQLRDIHYIRSVFDQVSKNINHK